VAVIKGINARVYACDDTVASTTFTGEATAANGDRTCFTITNTAKRFWDPSATYVVKLAGNPITSYSSLQMPGGRVHFASDPGAGAITVDGKYFAVAVFGQCKSFELAAEFDYYDATTFGDTMRVQVPAMRSATVSIQALALDDLSGGDDRFNLLKNANLVGLDLFLDATGSAEKRYAVYARPSNVTSSAAVDALIEQPLNFAVVDGPYYIAGLGVG